MIYASKDKENIYRFFYRTEGHKGVEILKIKSSAKTKGFIHRPLFNQKPHKISFTQNWLPLSLEFSKNKLVLNRHDGMPYYEFDASGDKPKMTVYSRNEFLFTAPEYEAATNAGIVVHDKAKGRAFRQLVRGLTVLAQVSARAYGELEEGIPVLKNQKPNPPRWARITKRILNQFGNMYAELEEGKPFNALKNRNTRCHE